MTRKHRQNRQLLHVFEDNEITIKKNFISLITVSYLHESNKMSIFSPQSQEICGLSGLVMPQNF